MESDPEIDAGEEQLDPDIFAELFAPVPDPEAEEAKDEGGEEGEEAADAVAEGSKETPTPTPALVLTPEQRAQIAREENQSTLTRLTAEKREREIAELLENGTDEEVARHFREQEIKNREDGKLQEAVNTHLSQYTDRVIVALITSEFVDALTPEQADRLDPRKWKGSDEEWIGLVTETKAEIARATAMQAPEFEAEVEKRVQERLKAAGYREQGEKLRASSPSNTPNSEHTEESEYDGLSHYDAKDKLFAAVSDQLFKT